MKKINLPDGWEVKKLGDVSQDVMYGLNSKAINFDGCKKYIRITDIDDNNKFNPKILTSPDGVFSDDYKLKEGDLLFARTGATVGKSYLYNKLDGDLYFAGFLIKFNIVNANPRFIFLQTQTKAYWDWVKSVSTRSGQPGINSKEFQSFPIILPPLEEQNRIVSILEEWDQAIEKTDALIKAKEDQFGWLLNDYFKKIERNKNLNFNKFGSILSESRVADIENNPKKRLTVRLNLNGVEARKYRGTEKDGATKYFKRSSGQLIYGKQNIFKGCIGIIPDNLDGYSSSQDLPAFDIGKNINKDWLYFYISRESFYKKLEDFMTGSGSKRLNPKELFNIKLKYPSLDEQERIVDVLNSAKKEIKVLKELSEKYRLQKQGLMQKLLSGEWTV